MSEPGGMPECERLDESTIEHHAQRPDGGFMNAIKAMQDETTAKLIELQMAEHDATEYLKSVELELAHIKLANEKEYHAKRMAMLDPLFEIDVEKGTVCQVSA